jgi:hypothetical protein
MLKLFIFATLLVAATIATSLSVRPDQTLGVKGVLKCNGKPEKGVLVKLYDHDTLSLDDKIASGRTDAQGHFEISGTAHEISRITPKFNIYHDCNDGIKPCQRKVSITIPKSYVTAGGSAKKIYDAGTIELAGQFSGEERDCLH